MVFKNFEVDYEKSVLPMLVCLVINLVACGKPAIASMPVEAKSPSMNVAGSATETKNGTTAITIEVETEDLRTVQDYIVGDYEFVMVQMSDFHARGKCL